MAPKKIIKLMPSIIWMVVIFFFSSQQTTGIGTNTTNRFLILKSFHLIEYAILAILLSFVFFKKQTVIIISYLYAISDEFHQSFIPGRTSRFRDTLIDLIGILIGVFIFKKLFSSKRNRNHLY